MNHKLKRVLRTVWWCLVSLVVFAAVWTWVIVLPSIGLSTVLGVPR